MREWQPIAFSTAACAAAILILGCDKNSPPSPPVKPPVPSGTVSSTQRTNKFIPDPVSTNNSAAKTIELKLISSNPADNLEVLNQALAKWILQKGTPPNEVTEMVRDGLLPMLPMAPTGQTFSIDQVAHRVVLIPK